MRVLRAILGAAALVVIGALLWLPTVMPQVLRFEHWTADWRTSLLADTPAGQNADLALVLINNDTLKDYVSSPIDRSLLARIVTAVDAAGAKAIGLDILFLKRTDAEKDKALVDALKSARAKVILGVVDERGDLQPFQREFQGQFIRAIGRPAGYLNFHYDHDGVVRYTAGPNPASTAYPKSFARLLAEAGGAAPEGDSSRPIPWLGKPRDGSGTFLALAAQDLLADAAKGAALKGRIVLIGGDFPLRDRHRVPTTTRTGEMVAGLEIHAQIIAGLMDPKRTISELKPMAASALLGGGALVGFAIGWSLWRSGFVPYLGAGFATVLLLVLDAMCFKGLRVLLPFTLAVIAWVAGLTAGSSLRFIVPPKRRSQP